MSIHASLNQQFYKKSTWIFLLIPFSIVFWLLITLRKILYRINIFKIYELQVPLVIVGNITIGGTGKTPLIIFLAQKLAEKKLNVGIISRGYKSKKNYPREVTNNSDYLEVGDEPLLIKKNLNIPVFVGKNRVQTAKKLLEEYEKIDVILSDDGLQNYALHRDFELAVVDGDRYFGNNFLLPAGPLREPVSRLENVDAVVVNGEKNKITKYKTMTCHYSNIIFNIHNLGKKTLKSLVGSDIIVMTAIGNPDRLLNYLRTLKLQFKSITFNDHHHFQQNDFKAYKNNLILMTEKDAIKCESIEHNNIWYLPINVRIDEKIINNMLKKLKLKHGSKLT